LARPKKENLAQLWQMRIDKAHKFREEDFDERFRPGLARRWFEGDQRPDNTPDGEWITVNKIYSHLLTELPALYGIDPYFYVKVRKSYNPDPIAINEFEARGKIREAYLNYLKAELDLKTKARLAILDAEFAFGVIKVSYHADTEENPDKGTPILDENNEPVVDEDGTAMMNPDEIVTNEKYKLTRVHPDNIFWDRDAGPLEDDWGWIAHKIELSRPSAEADKTLNARAVSTANKKPRKEEDYVRSATYGSKVVQQDPDEEVLTLYEIYDLKKKQWLKVLEGADVLAMDPEPVPMGVEGHPFCILRFVLRDKSPYPIPPTSQVLDQQQELNEARTKAVIHRKRFNRKYEVNTSLLENEDELDKLAVGDDGTIIQVMQNGAISPIRDAPMDVQTYTEISALNRDFLELMGPDPSSLQVSRADSATEAAIVDQRMEIREGDKLSTVTDWIIMVGRKLDQLVQSHITRDEAVRIAGPSGEMWQLVQSDDYQAIEGEFEYGVNVGASQPRIPAIERSQLLAFFQVLGQFPQLMTSERLMSHMAKLHNIDDESLIQEMMAIGQQVSQQLAQQGQGEGGGMSPVAGVNPENPITAALGAALGGQGVDNTPSS